MNIQDHKIFDSHLLNRDVWTNETLVSLIRMNFLFWQRGSTSIDAKQFIASYHINETELPVIGIIDTRTGELLLTMKVNNSLYDN